MKTCDQFDSIWIMTMKYLFYEITICTGSNEFQEFLLKTIRVTNVMIKFVLFFNR